MSLDNQLALIGCSRSGVLDFCKCHLECDEEPEEAECFTDYLSHVVLTGWSDSLTCEYNSEVLVLTVMQVFPS